MEVASREVWNFRGDRNAVAARLQDVCMTAPDFLIPDKNVLARQAVGHPSALPSCLYYSLMRFDSSSCSRSSSLHSCSAF